MAYRGPDHRKGASAALGLALGLALFFAADAASPASSIPQHSVALTSDIQTLKPSDQFSCRETVYAVVTWAKLPAGTHELTAEWIGPSGKPESQATIAVRPSDESSWMWLQLEGGGGGQFLRLISPEKGFQDFIGDWKVNLYLNERFIAAKSFTVAC